MIGTTSIVLAGVILDVRDLTDQWKGALVRHETPGRNGGVLEWLGWNALEFRLSTTFEAKRIQEWIELAEALRGPGPFQLVHPLHGTLSVYVEAIEEKLTDSDALDVEFTIVESALDRPGLARPSARDVVAQLSQGCLDAAAASLAKPFAPNAPPAVDASEPGWLDRIGSLGNRIDSYVADVKGVLGRIAGLRAAVTAPVSAAYEALAFAATVPGEVARQVTGLFDQLAGREGPNPVLSAQRLVRDCRAICASFRGSQTEGAVRLIAATVSARAAAEALDRDEAALRALRAREAAPAFDDEGNRLQDDVDLQIPATSEQAGRLVFLVRQLINEARPFMDDPEPFDRLALALLVQFRDRLVELESVREIVVHEPTPLHLVCHRQGLPYNAAERLVALNGLRNPSFVLGRLLVYG